MKHISQAALVMVLAALPLPSRGQVIFGAPERFGVIDITPNNLSGESDQNDSPTLGVGVSANYGKFVVNANNSSLFAGFSTNHYYTSTSASTLGLPWVGPDFLSDVGEAGNDFTG